MQRLLPRRFNAQVRKHCEHAQEEAEEQKAQLEEPKESPLPEGFVEWETVSSMCLLGDGISSLP